MPCKAPKVSAPKSDNSPRRFIRKVKLAPKTAPRAYLGHETDGRTSPREPGHVKPVPYIKRAPRRRPEFDLASMNERNSLHYALNTPSREQGWVYDLCRYIRRVREEGENS